MLEKTWSKDKYLISTDKTKLQVKLIRDFLNSTYWAEGISSERVKVSIENSVCFGIYHDGIQVGFARCITDFATFGYLCDVFILPDHRKAGLSKWLLECIFSVEELNLKRWFLATRDAHDLYKKMGFQNLSNPKIFMEKFKPSFYLDNDRKKAHYVSDFFKNSRLLKEDDRDPPASSQNQVRITSKL